MPLKHQQPLKILSTAIKNPIHDKERMPTVVPLLKAIYCLCVRLCQLLLWVKTLPPNLIFGAAYRLMSVSKQHMTHIAQTVFQFV